jgi:hypothetical protein
VLQAMDPHLMSTFQGYSSAAAITTKQGGRTYVTTPAVVRTARDLLGCRSLPGALLEDSLGSAHWEESIFKVAF